MSTQYIILRRTTLNSIIIEDARFIGLATSYEQALVVAKLFQDDTTHISKALVGFSFDFYIRTYE